MYSLIFCTITSTLAINVSSIKLIFPITVPNDITTEIPDKSDVTKLRIKFFFQSCEIMYVFYLKRRNAGKLGYSANILTSKGTIFSGYSAKSKFMK
jgi:hypothetical protein